MPIRQALEADRRALSELDRRAWTLETNPILPDGKTWFEGDVALENVLVAYEGDAVVGYVHLDDALPPHLFSAAHSGRIRGISVAPDGKTRTIVVSGTDAQGNKFSNTGVYDKQ